MELTVHTQEGTAAGIVQLSDGVFGIEPNTHVMYLDVKQYQANQRQGTHRTKTRGEVSGSTKKPYKQKGTGNARQGHKRSPLHRHGGTVHGPMPRDYGFKLNRKVKQLARRSALSLKARAESIRVLEGIRFEDAKTRYFIQMLGALSLSGRKVLFVTAETNADAFRAGRNIPGVSFALASHLHTYDILNTDILVLDRPAVDTLHQILLETETA